MRSLHVVLAALVLAVTALVVLAQASFISPGMYNDLAADYASARAFLHGQDAYGETRELLEQTGESAPQAGSLTIPEGQVNPHPPASVLLVLPLGALSWVSARWVWVTASILALFCGAFLLLRELRLPSTASTMTTAAAAALIVLLPVSHKNLLFGQTGPVLFLLLIGAWAAVRKERLIFGGIALGVMSAIKLYPIAILPLLLLQRQWRLAVSLTVTFLAVTVPTAFLFGLTPADYLSASRLNLHEWGTSPYNLSPQFMAVRAFGPIGVDTESFVLAAMGLLSLLAVIWLGRMFAPDSVADSLFHWAAWAMLASPLLWDHYLLLAVPLGALLLRRFRAGPTRAPIFFALFLIGLSFSAGQTRLSNDLMFNLHPLIGLMGLLGTAAVLERSALHENLEDLSPPRRWVSSWASSPALDGESP